MRIVRELVVEVEPFERKVIRSLAERAPLDEVSFVGHAVERGMETG